MYLINLKNLICVDIVKINVKFCLLLDFLHRFLKKFASTGGPHEISHGPHAARGPRVGQHCFRAFMECFSIFLEPCSACQKKLCERDLAIQIFLIILLVDLFPPFVAHSESVN